MIYQPFSPDGVQNYAPFSTYKKLTFCNISLLFTEDVYLKLGVRVHYPKSNSHYQGRQFKRHFSELCPSFDLEKTSPNQFVPEIVSTLPCSSGASPNQFVPEIVSTLPCLSGLIHHILLFVYFSKELISFTGSHDKCHISIFNALIIA